MNEQQKLNCKTWMKDEIYRITKKRADVRRAEIQLYKDAVRWDLVDYLEELHEGSINQ